MICLLSNRPALQIGPHHQVIGYETDWLEQALQRAANAAGREDFPFIDEICHGIIYYLENKCPLSLLPIEDLYIRIEKMLKKIGCESVANQLTVLSPPVTVSFLATVEQLDFAFELGFFQQLQSQLDELRVHGVEAITFTDLNEAVLRLRSARRWTRQCEALAADIRAFAANYSTEPLFIETPAA